MKQNLDFYKEDILFNTSTIEKQIMDNNDWNNMEINVENLLVFSDIRKNIISWYPFEKDSTILEIGANYGELTEELCKKSKKVVSVEFSKTKGDIIANRCKAFENLEIIIGNIKDIKFNEKFDYITLIGCFEYAPLLIKEENSYEKLLILVKSLLKENGKILIATDNKFGMRNWSVFNKDDKCLKTESVNSSKDNNCSQLLSKKNIEKIIKKLNYDNIKFYYPLPDYRFPNVFFTDDFLPKAGNMHRNLSVFYDSEVVNFHENAGFTEIINNDVEMFPFFANSYFIEIGNNKNNQIKYISYWNNRNKKYKLQTIIQDDVVIKCADNELSKAHIEQMKNNIDILNNQKIKTLDSYNENQVISKFKNNVKSYDSIIVKAFKEKGIDEVIKLINKFKNEVLCKLKIEENSNNVFRKYNIEIDDALIKDLNFTKQGLWDLNFQNSFYIDNEFYIYDQEWITEDIPIEFILYRGLIIFDELKKIVDIDEILKRLDIFKYKNVFDKLETIITKDIIDDKIESFYLKNVETIRGCIINNSKYQNELTIKENEINQLKNVISQKDNIIETVTNSKSWKITKPLRSISEQLRKKE